MLYKKVKFVYVAFLLLLNVNLYAQSAEAGNAFNKYMSPESGINPMSGTVNFSVPLTTISAGEVSASFNLKYSGNVQKSVQTRNDISSTGWVGLGWSLGNGKIVSDNRNTMKNSDDEYSFITAEGVTYRIYKEEDLAGNFKKWWIDGLPYWKVERKTQDVQIGGKSFNVVIGWILTDDNGKKYEYGDMKYCSTYNENTFNSESDCSPHHATEYELGWAAYGYTGESIGGNDSPYPKAWNMSKMTDLYGDSLTFYYTQYLEGIKHKTYNIWTGYSTWNSTNKYTKECYLTKVESSKGSSLEFVLEDKGVGEYDGELVDAVGRSEILSSDEIDAFVDPMERKYLSQIKIYGMDRDANGNKVLFETIELCYSPLTPKISEKNDAENKKYTKRLLKNIVWINGNGLEINREKYEYNDNVNFAYKNNNYPLGMMKKIEGSDCGSVDFKYDRIEYSKSKGMHQEEVPLIKASLGYLRNGTPYLVGLDKKKNNVSVYYWVNGSWSVSQVISGLSYHEDGYFSIKENDWFIYVTDYGATTSYDMIPVKWNGEKWIAGTPIHDVGKGSFVADGPNYIVKVRIDRGNDEYHLSVPWTEWGRTYDESYFETISAETGATDDMFLKVTPTRNHFVVAYNGPGKHINTGRVSIYSFLHIGESTGIVRTFHQEGLDDDQMYYAGNGYFFGAVESKDWWGQGAVSYHWKGDGWVNGFDMMGLPVENFVYRMVDGVQQVPRAMATGYNYVALRHNDNDDMTLFNWNGDYWETPYDGVNMVHDDDLDLIVESEWDAPAQGDDFFVARRPRIGNKIEIPILCWLKPYWIGLKMKCIMVEVWSSTYPAARIQYYHRRNGRWSNGGENNTTGNDNRKKVIAGSNWYIEKRANKAYIWNGFEWKEESLNVSWRDGDDFKDASVIGDFFVVEDDGKSIIYYKKDDSFKSDHGIFVVSEKKISDNVTDKVTSYTYKYVFDDDINVGFDYINNTPLISKFIVDMPEHSGRLTKTLCKVDPKFIGLGQGSICKEQTIENGKVAKSVEKKYHRHRGSSWPEYIYVDKVDSVITYVKGSKTIAATTFNIDLNGSPSKELVYDGGKSTPSSEKVITYAAEKSDYSFMKDANRLQEPVMNYICKPNCSSGKVVSANAMRYSKTTTNNPVAQLYDEWTLSSNQRVNSSAMNSFKWDVSQNNSTPWLQTTEITKYIGSKAVEVKDKFGEKKSYVFDNDTISALRATVSNAGLDEILIVPGDTCVELGMTITQCKMDDPLSGNAVIGSGPDYGRFSNKAIDLRTPFFGALRNAKKGKYRFSAWVQNVDNTPATFNFRLSTSATNLPLKSYFKDANSWVNGAWKYVEWIGNIDHNGRIDLFLTASGHVRVQDIRMVPATSDVEVKYYDKHFNKSVVDVNDRGIAKYQTLDDRGRVIDIYGEDVNGNLVLALKNKYFSGTCRESAVGPDVLKSLEINSDVLDLPENPSEDIYYRMSSLDEDIVVKWTTPSVYDSVRYRLYAAGTDTATWHRSCCSVLEGVKASIEGADSWIMELDVEPFNANNAYKIHIEKSKVGWLPFGNSLQKGNKPIFFQHTDSSSIAYITSDGIYTADFTGNTWLEKLAGVTLTKKVFSLKNSSQYLFGVVGTILTGNNINNNARVYLKNQNSWNLQGNILDASYVSKNLSATLDAQGNPCIAYEKKVTTSSGDYTLSVSCYKNSTWSPIGGTAKFGNSATTTMTPNGSCVMFDTDYNNVEPSIVSGLVTDSSVSAHDMVLGPGNKLYVAYVGNMPYADIVMENVKNSLPDHSGIPDSNYSVSVPKVLMIKRLFTKAESGLTNPSSDLWAGPSLVWNSQRNKDLPNYLGDVVVIDSAEPIAFVHDLKLAANDTCLYMAVVHDVFLNQNSEDSFEGGAKRAISVYKGRFVSSYNENNQLEKNLVFVPYEDASVASTIHAETAKKESRIVAYLEDDSPFDFMVKGDTPYISFANEQNGNALTVIKYDKQKSRWLSVGQPAFTYSSIAKDAASIAVGSNGTPVAVTETSSDFGPTLKRGHIVPWKYVSSYQNEKDYDLTLSSIAVNNVSTTIPSEFRQYILNYSAKVDSTVSMISVTPTLMNSNDVVGIRLMKNGNKVATKNLKSASNYSFFWGEMKKQKVETSLKMDVPLDEGENEISIEIRGKNGLVLTYTIHVNRERLKKKYDELGEDNRGVYDYDISSDDDLKKVVPGDTAVYIVNTKKDSSQICVSLPFGLGVIYRGKYIHRNTCFDVKFPGGNPDTLIFVSDNGDDGKPQDTSVVIIVPNNPNTVRYSSSSEDYVVSSSSISPYYSSSNESSSSVPPYYSSSNESSSSEVTSGCIAFVNGTGNYDENCYNSGLEDMIPGKCYTMNPDRMNENPIWISQTVSQTWWWIETPCVEVAVSSSSCGGSGCISSSSSSVSPVYSSSSINDIGDGGAKEGDGNIPVIYTSLIPNKLLATGTLMLADRANVSGTDFGGSFVEVGANASVTGRIVSRGNVSLRSNSTTGDVMLAGSLNVETGAAHGSVSVTNVPAANFYAIDFVVGSTDVNVYNGQTRTITPGLYNELHAYTGSTVYMEPGDYYFDSFSIEPNTYILFKKPIRLWVKNTFYIADGINAVSEGSAEELFIYTNTTNDMYLGVYAALKAFLVAPNSSVNLAPGSNWTGSIWAKNINVQADAVVK